MCTAQDQFLKVLTIQLLFNTETKRKSEFGDIDLMETCMYGRQVIVATMNWRDQKTLHLLKLVEMELETVPIQTQTSRKIQTVKRFGLMIQTTMTAINTTTKKELSPFSHNQ